VSACSRQQSDWEKTRAANTTDAYELFLKKYPSGEFTAQAQARVKELYEERDWQKARDVDNVEAYQAFLKQYPEGKWSEEARIRIENFTLASAPTNSVPAAPAAAASQQSPPPAAPAKKPAAAAAAKAASASGTGAYGGAGANGGTGAYGVQLGAFKSGAQAANKRWTDLSAKYPKLLGDLSPQVSPRKGTAGNLYRLRVVNLSAKRARSICTSLKAHAQSCAVLPPAHHRASAH
jgi:cell division protein FtsN